MAYNHALQFNKLFVMLVIAMLKQMLMKPLLLFLLCMYTLHVRQLAG